MKNMIIVEENAPAKKAFIHNLDFDSWNEMKTEETKKKKQKEKEEKEKYDAWL